jgi:acylphosphatase
MAVLRKRYLLSGRVQRVGFRYFASHLAHELGLLGCVRNLPDGSVEIEAQGEESRLEEFLMEIQRGPQLAVVRDIAIEDCVPLASDTTFAIET